MEKLNLNAPLSQKVIEKDKVGRLALSSLTRSQVKYLRMFIYCKKNAIKRICFLHLRACEGLSNIGNSGEGVGNAVISNTEDKENDESDENDESVDDESDEN